MLLGSSIWLRQVSQTSNDLSALSSFTGGTAKTLKFESELQSSHLEPQRSSRVCSIVISNQACIYPAKVTEGGHKAVIVRIFDPENDVV